MNRNIIKLLL